MTEITVTPLYVGLISIVMAVLSTRAAMLRGRFNVALGDGGQPALFLAQRRFGNLAEYAAMALLILLLLELRGVSQAWLHGYGATLVVLRLIHPLALFDRAGARVWQKAGRFVSAAGTALLLLAGGIALILA